MGNEIIRSARQIKRLMESEMEVHSASESEEELVQKVSNFNIFQSSSEDESSGDESSEDKNSSGDDTSSPKDINHKVAKDVKVTKVENTEDELLNLAIKENVKWEKKHKSEVVDTTRFHLFKCGKSNLNAAKELKKMFGVGCFSSALIDLFWNRFVNRQRVRSEGLRKIRRLLLREVRNGANRLLLLEME